MTEKKVAKKKKEEPTTDDETAEPVDPSDSLVECPKCPDGSAKVKIGNLKRHYAEVHGEAEFDLSGQQRKEFEQINNALGQLQAQLGAVRMQMALIERQGMALTDQRTNLLNSYAKAADIAVTRETTFQWDLRQNSTIKVNLPKEGLPPRQNQ